MSIKQYDIFDLRRRVSEVLYYMWDPIGVSDHPSARGEYESYVSEIHRLVEENTDIKPISDRLSKIANVTIGLSFEKAKCDHIAEILLAHKEAIKAGDA